MRPRPDRLVVWRWFAALIAVALATLVVIPGVASASADSPVVAEALRILPSLTTLDAYGPYVAGEYPSKYAAFHGAYAAALPKGVPRRVLAYNDWMTTANAVENPVRLIRWSGGGVVVWSTLCMPHNCGDNQMTILFAPGRQRAWGVAGLERHIYVFGDPSTAQRALLLALFASEVASMSNELKLPVDTAAMKRARAEIKESRGDFSRFFPH
jgi:inhibitor of lysozyme (Ivy)